MINVLLITFGILALAGEVILLILIIYPRIQSRQKASKAYTPSVAVIVPCKGVREHFEENVNALCTQEYPSFDIFFIIDSKEDSAYPILHRLQSTYQHVAVKVSDPLFTCSGKIAAQLKGISDAGLAEVYVFADSDIKPHSKWLHYLIQPLQDEHIGATTGYRWYFPEHKTTAIISTWNMMIMVGLLNQSTRYTWGGSTAIKRTTFETLHVADAWRNGLSDDLILTELLKKKRYSITFVPQSVVESHADENLASFLRWASGQMTWIRWYYPSLWLFSFFLYLGFEALIGLGIVLLLFGNYLLGMILSASILLQMMIGYAGLTTFRAIMCYPKERFRSAVLPTVLSPFVFALIFYTLIVSGLKRKVIWCGRTYRKSDAKA